MTRTALARLCASTCAFALLHSSVALAAPADDPPAAEAPADASAPENGTGGATNPDDATAPPDADPASSGTEPDATEAPPAEPEPAAAPDPDPTEQEAAALFREGSMFYELGQYEDAIGKFEAAWKLAPVPQLLFNLGQAHRRWYEIDPDIDHLRQSRTFFVNYDKRMKTDASYSAREADYVQNMIEKLEAQIELEEAKEAERNRVIVNGPSAADMEALEKRRLKRDKQLAASGRLNGAGIGLIVVGSVAAGVGLGGILARTAYGVVLDNSATGNPNSPSLATAGEDRRRRNGYLLSGQVGFGGLIAAAVFLPIGIGLRIGGGVLEKRALGGAAPDATGDDKAPDENDKLAPKVAVEPTASGLAIRF